MFSQVWDSGNKKFCLYLTIKTPMAKKFRVTAQDARKPNSKYADRTCEVNGERMIYLSFPVSPRQVVVTVMNPANPDDKEFTVNITEGNIRSNELWLDSETRSFVQLAIIFCQTCGFTSIPKNYPYLAYKSSDELYNIRYFNVIRDYASGAAISTPARIGHQTGTIEVSKQRFDPYTIPMRMIILLHEFSHKYKNPKQGMDISNETGADMNALYIFLGLGFSAIDAIYVFSNVFLKAQTPGNIERMRKIVAYIDEFKKKQNA